MGDDAKDPRFIQTFPKNCWNKRTAQGMRKAIGYFHLALGEDANLALAYAGLAEVSQVRYASAS